MNCYHRNILKVYSSRLIIIWLTFFNGNIRYFKFFYIYCCNTLLKLFIMNIKLVYIYIFNLTNNQSLKLIQDILAIIIFYFIFFILYNIQINMVKLLDIQQTIQIQCYILFVFKNQIIIYYLNFFNIYVIEIINIDKAILLLIFNNKFII